MEINLEDLNPSRRLKEVTTFSEVRSHREFASILNLERDRADRTGQEFSLVVFSLATDGGYSACARQLVPVLTNRIRSTDSIGWLEDGRLCVVLSRTVPDNAWKFVGNVRNALNGGAAPVECIVYSYPSCWPPRPDETPTQGPLSLLS